MQLGCLGDCCPSGVWGKAPANKWFDCGGKGLEAPRPRLYDPYNHFTSEKVGGACSYLGVIGQKIGGALASVAAPLGLWLPHPCMFSKNCLFITRYLFVIALNFLW